MELSTPRPRLVVALVAALVIAGGAAVWFLVLADDGPGHPDRWDPRVVDLVTFVESDRGLGFRHPVAIEVVADAEFATAVAGSTDGVTESDQRHLDELIDLVVALNLVPDPADRIGLLRAAWTAVHDGGRLAVYLPGQHRIVVRGEVSDAVEDGFDPLTEARVVAALGEALHDQHYDLTRAARVDRSREVFGPRAVRAGIGELMAVRYVRELEDSDLEASHAAHLRRGDGDGPADLVAVLALLPEILGGAFMELVLADASVEAGATTWASTTTHLVTPPRTEVEVLDPWLGMVGFERVGVPAPPLDDGAELLAEGDLGAATLYLLLALRVDALDALEASSGWAGDTYVVTRDGQGRRCTQIAVVGRDGFDTDRFEEQMTAWVDAAPAGSDASVDRERAVTLRSCEVVSGSAPDLEHPPGVVASVPVVWTGLVAELRADDVSRGQAECVADLALSGLALLSPDEADGSRRDDGRFETLLRDSLRACRAQAS